MFIVQLLDIYLYQDRKSVICLFLHFRILVEDLTYSFLLYGLAEEKCPAQDDNNDTVTAGSINKEV